MLQPSTLGRVSASTFVCLAFLVFFANIFSVLAQDEDKPCEGDACTADLGVAKVASTTRTLDEQGAALLAQLWPHLPHIGISGVVGYACGLLIKEAIQVLILAAAAIVTAVQVLAYMGWVTVHWDRISGDLAGLLGEGSIDKEGADAAELFAMAMENLSAVVAQGLPSVAGFATGLTLAFMPGNAVV